VCLYIKITWILMKRTLSGIKVHAPDVYHAGHKRHWNRHHSFNFSILIPKFLKLGHKTQVNVPHNRICFYFFGFLAGKWRHKIGAKISSSHYDQNDHIVSKELDKRISKSKRTPILSNKIKRYDFLKPSILAILFYF
jgi:hypothetical protein